jgi:hypothetical protein
MMNKGLVPGAAAINVLMRRDLNIDLTDPQANDLWEQCRLRLVSAGALKTLAAAQDAYYGELEHRQSLELSKALWHELMGEPRRSESEGGEPYSQFYAKLLSNAAQRGYVQFPTQIAMFSPFA